MLPTEVASPRVKQSGKETNVLYLTDFERELLINTLETSMKDWENEEKDLAMLQGITAMKSVVKKLKMERPLVSFSDDEEKMRDFEHLTKDEFLASYSYLTEGEYDAVREAYTLHYRGYEIEYIPHRHEWRVEANGHTIAYEPEEWSIDEIKTDIDYHLDRKEDK
jgi:hypothetical protein